MNSNNNNISTFARLLATENITVRHNKDAKTASFDMVARVLTLPHWKVVDEHVYDMLVGHEVAHALFTDNTLDPNGKYLKVCYDIDNENPENAMPYFNIVEDARIERLIKDKFPGIRRDFIKGYRYLHETLNIFEIEDVQQVRNMMLADRLNLHFKLGIISIVDVPFFNDEERVFVERMESATTAEEVVAISRDLYLHSAKECEGRHQKGPQGYSDISGENTGNGKEGGEEGEEGDGESNNTTGSLGGHYAGPMTASAFNNIARAEPERYRYEDNKLVPIPLPNLDRIIVQPEEIQSDWNAHHEAMRTSNDPRQRKGWDEMDCTFDVWVSKEKPTINNLVKQFEMRKAAKEHQRIMIHKTGRLDTLKMNNYRWSEDIFARNTEVREGKNHGIVIFVDWSGSMSNTLLAVAEQALTLAFFAKQANIPFELIAFSDRHPTHYSSWGADERTAEHNPESDAPDWYWQQDGTVTIDANGYERNNAICGTLQLFRFLHSGMNRSEFLMAAKTFYNTAVINTWNGNHLAGPSRYSLSGTPLDETIAAAHQILLDFRSKNNIQILNCAFITDGNGSSNAFHSATITNPWTNKQYGDRPNHKTEDGYRLGSTNLLLMSLKETTGCNLIGMYLNTSHSIENAHGWYSTQYDGGHYYGRSTPVSPRLTEDRALYRKENYCIANGHNSAGYDEAFIIKDSTRVDQTDCSELPEGGTVAHAKLRNDFVKSLKKKGMSRTFIRRFVDIIAR